MNEPVSSHHRPFTRRQFLQRSAVAAGATAFGLSAFAKPKVRRVSPNEKLNIAIIGTGNRGGGRRGG